MLPAPNEQIVRVHRGGFWLIVTLESEDETQLSRSTQESKVAVKILGAAAFGFLLFKAYEVKKVLHLNGCAAFFLGRGLISIKVRTVTIYHSYLGYIGFYHHQTTEILPSGEMQLRR